MSISKRALAFGTLIVSVGVVTSVSAQRRQPPDGAGARRGGPMVVSGAAERIQKRSYLFKETNQKIEYDVFVSAKVNKRNKSPLVIALHGQNAPPMSVLRSLADAADAAGYIVAAPMGTRSTAGTASADELLRVQSRQISVS